MAFVSKNCFVRDSNLCIPLSSDLFCASYLGKLVIGNIETDERLQTRFGNRSLAIPNEHFFNFVSMLRKGKTSYQTSSTIPFEEIVFQPTKTHRLVAIYNNYGDEGFRYGLRLKWGWLFDKKYQEKIKLGQAEPIEAQNNAEWLFLQRGFTLSEDQLDILMSQLKPLLENTFYHQPDSAMKIQEFLDFMIDSKPDISEILDNFPNMDFVSKKKCLQEWISQMYKEKGLDMDDFSQKNLLDCLAGYMSLIFALFNHFLGN